MALFGAFRAKRHYAAGTVALQEGDFQVAVAHLATAVELKPDWPKAQHNYGCALMASADFSGAFLDRTFFGPSKTAELAGAALAAFDEAVRIQSIFPEAHNNRGRALAKLQRFFEADEAFATALRQRPGYENALANRRWLDNLTKELEAALETEPDADTRRWLTDALAPRQDSSKGDSTLKEQPGVADE